MTSYRLYLVSGLTRRFEPAQEFDARNDRAATAIAEEMRSAGAAELWSGNRIVREWKGEAGHDQMTARGGKGS